MRYLQGSRRKLSTIITGSPEDILVLVWGHINTEYYKDNPCSDKYQNITLSMFTDPARPRKTFPVLKGKAAEVKHLMPALLWAWRRSMDGRNPQHEQVELLLRCTVYLDECMDIHRDSDALPPGAADNFMQAGFAVNSCMNSLQTHYASLGVNSEFLFNIVPKNHYLMHICLRAGHLNPRMAACYIGEDMMHQMRRLTAGCVRGNGPKQAGIKLVGWYAHALSRLLSDNHNGF